MPFLNFLATFLHFSHTSFCTIFVSKNKIPDFSSGPLYRPSAVFHCGMGNSMEFMPSPHTYRRNVQNWSEAYFLSEKKRKKKFPPANRIYINCRKILCCFFFFLCHVNVCCKLCHLFSPIISAAPLQMMQLSQTLLEMSICQRTLLVNKRHCNKLGRPFWCYSVLADLLATYCLFKFKATWNRDLAFLCWL